MESLKKVDFHIHSNASDGCYSPRKLIQTLSEAGLAAAGLTDHDTVSGLQEAQEAANEFGIELIPGVEISVLDDDVEVHILGYYPRDLIRLTAALEKMQQERFIRMEQIIEKLKNSGFRINTEDVLTEAGRAAPGRLHLARLMVKKKYVHTPAEAFSLYLNRGQAAYVPRRTPGIEEIMSLLSGVGAITVIAHPGEKGKRTVEKLLPLGLEGIEVFHPDHNKPLARYFRNLALDKKLLITGGSDFHGDPGPGSTYPGNLAISYSYLTEMKRIFRG